MGVQNSARGGFLAPQRHGSLFGSFEGITSKLVQWSSQIGTVWRIVHLFSNLTEREGGEVSWTLASAKLDPKTPVVQPKRAVCSVEPELACLETTWQEFSKAR